jgi:hypothetical protein
MSVSFVSGSSALRFVLLLGDRFEDAAQCAPWSQGMSVRVCFAVEDRERGSLPHCMELRKRLSETAPKKMVHTEVLNCNRIEVQTFTITSTIFLSLSIDRSHLATSWLVPSRSQRTQGYRRLVRQPPVHDRPCRRHYCSRRQSPPTATP